MEPESPSPSPQVPATFPYPEPIPFSPLHTTATFRLCNSVLYVKILRTNAHARNVTQLTSTSHSLQSPALPCCATGQMAESQVARNAERAASSMSLVGFTELGWGDRGCGFAIVRRDAVS